VSTLHAQDKTRTGALRTRVRRATIAFAVGLFALVSLPVAALADTPRAWEEEPHVSGLQFLVVLVLIPAGLFALVSLFAALPSMIKDKGYEPGQSWRSEAEWFGGPRKGIEATDELSHEQIEAAESDRGGTSGQW
jgi:NADH:ubiquinone oxidoreductase subunit 5 (subunit L)/multisubunit Na+/H+ antiporter MnhA subunit